MFADDYVSSIYVPTIGSSWVNCTRQVRAGVMCEAWATVMEDISAIFNISRAILLLKCRTAVQHGEAHKSMTI